MDTGWSHQVQLLQDLGSTTHGCTNITQNDDEKRDQTHLFSGTLCGRCIRHGRTGRPARNKRTKMYKLKCNKDPLFFSREHGSVLVQSKREKGMGKGERNPVGEVKG